MQEVQPEIQVFDDAHLDEEQQTSQQEQRTPLAPGAVDQVTFFLDCIAYLKNICRLNKTRTTSKNRIIMSEINEMLEM